MPEAGVIQAVLDLATPLLAVGALAGLLAGLFGVGGGLVVVPALYFLLGALGQDKAVSMSLAVGTSLTAMVPTAVASARAHHRLGMVEWTILRIWVPFVAIGVILGVLLVSHIQSRVFVVSFSLLLLAVAINKLFGDRFVKPLPSMPSFHVQKAIAGLIGFVSAIAGVGGGAMSVPTLVYFGLPIHRAVGTSAALGLFVAIPGALGILIASRTPLGAPAGTFHLIYLPALVILVPLTIVCAPIGAKLAKRLPELWLKRLFSAVLICVGLRMLISV